MGRWARAAGGARDQHRKVRIARPAHLNPTVGIISSEKPPVCTGQLPRRTLARAFRTNGKGALTAMTLTSVVLPEFWRPTRVSSISCLKKRLPIAHTGTHMSCNTVDARRGGARIPAQPVEHLVDEHLEGRHGLAVTAGHPLLTPGRFALAASRL